MLLILHCSISYNRASSIIAPLGFRTKGWEWRNAIKEGDRIDIFDTLGVWFLGTAMNVRTIYGKNEKEIYVGYRIYTEDGTKKDNLGRNHEGWSENYDEWIPAYSLRLQK